VSSDVSLIELCLFEEEEEEEERLRDFFEKDGIELGYPSRYLLFRDREGTDV
jgi:small-conductance mechanosensitive channel